jgi:hypothetical protein
VSTLITRSFLVPKGQVWGQVLPYGGGPVAAHEGETVYIVVAHSYEAAVGEVLRKLNEIPNVGPEDCEQTK